MFLLNGLSGVFYFKFLGVEKGLNLKVLLMLSDLRSKLIWKIEDGKEVVIEMKGMRDVVNKMVV